jgi:DNA-binding NtrC family response regulator
MSQSLRVLIVEDNNLDASLLLRALRRGGYEPVYEVVDTAAAMRAGLERQDWDAITSDHAMPHFSALAALALAKELRPNVPFIIVSGEIDLNLAASLMKAGASDYIQKTDLAGLVPAIERELREVECAASANGWKRQCKFRKLITGVSLKARAMESLFWMPALDKSPT